MRRQVGLRLLLTVSAFLAGSAAVGLMGEEAGMIQRAVAAGLMAYALALVPLAYQPRPAAGSALAATLVLFVLGAMAFTPFAAGAFGGPLALVLGLMAIALAAAQAMCLRGPAAHTRDVTA